MNAVLMVLFVLTSVLATPAQPPQPTPKPIITCRYQKIAVWHCKNHVCRYEWATVKTCTAK